MSLRLLQQTHSVVWTNQKKKIHFFRSFASVGSARSNCVCRVHRWCSVQCQYDYGIRWRRYTYLSSPPPPQLTTIFLFLCCFVVPFFALVVFFYFSSLYSSRRIQFWSVLVLLWAERRAHIVIVMFSVFISWIRIWSVATLARLESVRNAFLISRNDRIFDFGILNFYFEFPTWRSVCDLCMSARSFVCCGVVCTKCVRVVDGTGRVERVWVRSLFMPAIRVWFFFCFFRSVCSFILAFSSLVGFFGCVRIVYGLWCVCSRKVIFNWQRRGASRLLLGSGKEVLWRSVPRHRKRRQRKGEQCFVCVCAHIWVAKAERNSKRTYSMRRD